jgi:hypothetical protein
VKSIFRKLQNISKNETPIGMGVHFSKCPTFFSFLKTSIMYHEKQMKRNVVGVLHVVMALEYGVPKIKTCLPHFKHVLIWGMSCSSHVLPYTYQFI